MLNQNYIALLLMDCLYKMISYGAVMLSISETNLAFEKIIVYTLMSEVASYVPDSFTVIDMQYVC